MANGDTENNVTWMSDVQRALAILLIGSVTFMIIMLTLRIMWSGDLATISALLKELKDALVNMSLIALGFFFGNTMAKMTQDAGQQKVVEKLTGVPVGPAPQVVVAWWSLLTDAEKAAVTTAAKADAKIQTVMAAFVSGKAEAPDLAALVTAGLLTQDRATMIAGLAAPNMDALTAAAIVAPAAAAAVAPPAADVAAPPAARKAVAEAMEEQGLTPAHDKPKD